jgi:hypothetical protein
VIGKAMAKAVIDLKPTQKTKTATNATIENKTHE